MAQSPDDSNQLQPSHSIPRTLQTKPVTIPVQAASGVISDIGDNAVTGRAEYIRQNTDEEMIWQETPSLVLLLPRFVKYAILMAIVIIACSMGRNYVGHNPWARAGLESIGIHSSAVSRTSEPGRRTGHKPRGGRRALDQPSDAASTDSTSAAAPDADQPPSETPYSGRSNDLDHILILVQVGFAGLLTLLFLAYLLKLMTTKYRASSQRLIVEEGSLHSVNRPYELHQLGDAVIVKPLLLRMFGISNLEITKPSVVLYGLRNADYVRDILRQGGQLEAQRVDKIRFR
ncbi:MAG: PH domain-containing protein [Terracidiphilus sp.]|nr:PH domain-containing protein [Terracidiphilus sp.]